ncbi:MAG TPA: sulfotransferase [Candidatus Sulfotelmatobacter sp.]|nr:sulfotransferase [Candidatus Sulfotelmatobacter sp.]
MPEVTEKLALPTKTTTTTTLFVVGVFRSGTSLLYALLNQHPEISLMYECDVWNFPWLLSELRFRHDWRERLEFYTNALSRHHLVLRDAVAGIDHLQTPQDLYRAFAESKRAHIIGEKSPFYCNHLSELARNHPGASFILIWRNPVEIFNSVEETARNSRYFRRPGMLSRLIYYQEQMIYGAAELVRLENRVHHVTYADLIDRTEESCRGLCRFLDIEFDNKMTQLAGADLSAVFRAPHFEHLRLGKIGRRQATHQVNPRVVRKLQRFDNRWNRMRHELLNFQDNAAAGPEPGVFERVYHRLLGRLFCGVDGAIRVGFEFLPLPWLRTYRQAKAWFNEGVVPPDQRLSMREEFHVHRATVLASLVVLGLVAAADYYTSVAVSLLPFYIIPAAIVTLVINRRWGTMASVVSALVWGFVQNIDNPLVNLKSPGVWFWDAFMRFLAVEIVVLLLDRIRIEIRNKKTQDAER